MKTKVLAISTFLMILVAAPFALAEKGGCKYRNHYHGFCGYPGCSEQYSGYGYGDYRALPPGLARRDHLPPGLERHLMERGTLPPGLQKRIGPYRYYDRYYTPYYYERPYYVPLPRHHSKVRIFVEF